MALINPFQANYHTDEGDKALIDKAVAGDKIALEQLVKKHQPFIYNLALKMVRCPDDAADMTQEVLVKVITKLSTFKGASAFRTWLYRIVVNDFIATKKRSHEEKIVSFEEHSNILDQFPDHQLTDMEMDEYRTQIEKTKIGCMSGMLLCLTRDQRMIYILSDLFKADHTIGASIMGISPGNYRVKLSRARKELSNYMQNRCGLMNKANPCRCHKKVKALMDMQLIDNKKVLSQPTEVSRFKDYIADSTLELANVLDDKAHELFNSHPRETQFDKKGFLEGVLADKKVVQLFNLDIDLN